MPLDQAPPPHLLRKAVELSREGVAILNGDQETILWHNRAFRTACQAEGELLGKPLRELFPEWRDGSADQVPPGWQSCEESGFRLVILSGPRRAEPADPLTGIANRAQLEQRLAALWTAAQSPGGPSVALLFIDLNDFKQINDAWGHLRGDEALRQVADRFQAALRADDFLARFGGDEFVALLSGWHRREDLMPIVQRLNDALRTPLQFGEHSAVVSASIGVAYSTDGHESPEALLHAADRAMYVAKDRTHDPS